MRRSFLNATEYIVEVVSPVHIGSGDRMSPLDYAVMTSNGKRLLVVYDFAALGLTDPVALEQLLQFVRDAPEWTRLMARARELGAKNPEGAVRYTVPMLAGGKAEEIVPFIRDSEDRAYIPGSSLKGAIRTALLYAWALEHDSQMAQSILGVLQQERRPRAEFAAGDLEKRVFGRDPNHDVMRALRVADSEPAPTDGLLRPNEAVIRVTRTGSTEEEALRQCLEVIKTGAKVRVRVTLDKHLFSPQVDRELRMNHWEQALTNWPAACRRFSHDLLEAQATMLDRFQDAGAEWCRSLKAKAAADPQTYLLPLGWGVGWEGKTVGMLMTDDIYAEIKAAFALAKEKKDPTQYIEGVFPATRWAIEMRSSNGTIMNVPLGWIRLRRVA